MALAVLNRKLATHQQRTQYHFDDIQLGKLAAMFNVVKYQESQSKPQ